MDKLNLFALLGYYYKGKVMNIKKVVLLIIICCSIFDLSAKRQKVHSFIKQEQSQDWYKEQSMLWKEYLQSHAQDADGWLNYYTAMRMIRVSGGDMNQKVLDGIVDEMEKAIPNSFEYHYICFWNAGFDKLDENFFHLSKAYELAPDRTETLDEFLTYYEIKRDMTKLKEVARKWYATNDIAPGLYYWNYNVLNSLDRDAILITSGDNDTYPALVMQYAKGIRADVNVLNHSLLVLDDYRNRYFKELGIPQMPFSIKSYETYSSFQSAMMKYLKKHTDRPIYFAVSAQPKLYKDFKGDVYNVGMAYKWSDEKFDNIAVIKKNYEKNYLVDYLKFNPSAHISNGVVDHMNANYLISLLPLYNHYVESDDVRAHQVEGLINRIARKNNMESKVAKILGRAKGGITSYVVSDPRKLEKGMVKVKENFYASATEISNEMYDLFLSDLLKQKRYDDLNMAKALAVNWRSLLPQEYAQLPDKKIFPNGHPNAPNAPIVNVSHAAAQLYCEWLTEVYNGLDHRKKKFGYVEFRLPTESEWELMASGGKSIAKYPWEGKYVRNAKGCFLGNYRVKKNDPTPATSSRVEDENKSCKSADMDGGFFPVMVETYWPNSYGLYNMTGNVSEMVSESGIVKGGSWNTRPEDATIQSKEKFNEPSPEVGFRVVMIVK